MPFRILDITDFDYSLPEELIAQFPAEPRDSARLCVWNQGKIEHRVFSDIVGYFREGDCLVVNNTEVIPARLIGSRESGGKVEVFLLEEGENNEWIAIGKPGRALRKGEKIFFNPPIRAEVVAVPGDDATRIIRFSHPAKELFEIGKIPLPPYIKRDANESDTMRYQTVFAKSKGAVAAPTAGLHFTDTLLTELKKKGVSIVEITLHVGLGTFKPVTHIDAKTHKVDKESYCISDEAVAVINKVRRDGGKIFASGTTVAKALETVAERGMPLISVAGKSGLYIYPPYKFKVVDALITNFHVPRSTLMLLVSAFIGRENILNLYTEAVNRQYRFLSYGDATLLIP